MASKILIDKEGKKYVPKVMIFSPLKTTNIVKRIKPVDTLHKDYKVYNEERGQHETWNNPRNKRIATISREAFNFLMQPEGSTVLKLSMVGIGKEFRKRGWSYRDACIILEVHDEIIVECLEELAEEAAAIMRKVMMDVMESVVDIIPVDISLGIGDNWAEAK